MEKFQKPLNVPAEVLMDILQIIIENEIPYDIIGFDNNMNCTIILIEIDATSDIQKNVLNNLNQVITEIDNYKSDSLF